MDFGLGFNFGFSSRSAEAAATAPIVSTLRAVNTGGTATTNITVGGVLLGSATAGYTTLADAQTAASDGDTIVFTETSNYDTDTSITKALTIAGADGVTARIKSLASGAAKNVTVLQLSLLKTETAEHCILLGHNATWTFNRCIVRKTGTYDCAAATAGTLNLYNCFFTADNVANVCVGASGGTVNAINCCAFQDAPALSAAFRNFGGFFNAQNCVVFVTTGDCYSGVSAIGNGNNFSSDITAPGSTNYRSQPDPFAAKSSQNLHWASRATMLSYAGVDSSETIGTLDIDNQTRAEQYIGADYVPA